MIAVVVIVYPVITFMVCAEIVQKGAFVLVAEKVITMDVAKVPPVTSPAVSVDPVVIVGLPVPVTVGIVPVVLIVPESVVVPAVRGASPLSSARRNATDVPDRLIEGKAEVMPPN